MFCRRDVLVVMLRFESDNGFQTAEGYHHVRLEFAFIGPLSNELVASCLHIKR